MPFRTLSLLLPWNSGILASIALEIFFAEKNPCACGCGDLSSSLGRCEMPSSRRFARNIALRQPGRKLRRTSWSLAQITPPCRGGGLWAMCRPFHGRTACHQTRPRRCRGFPGKSLTRSMRPSVRSSAGGWCRNRGRSHSGTNRQAQRSYEAENDI